jgi:purine-binding chemotaxis protein CheW
MPLRRQMVVFKIGREDFALDILRAKEVVVRREITPVPDAAVCVEGIMNLRGNLVPVIDLRKRLRAAQSDCETEERIIVVDVDGMLAGLIVDGASELIRVSEGDIEKVPDLLTDIGASYLTGIINQDGRYIGLIDVGEVLNGEVRCELGRVAEVLAGWERSSHLETVKEV